MMEERVVEMKKVRVEELMDWKKMERMLEST